MVVPTADQSESVSNSAHDKLTSTFSWCDYGRIKWGRRAKTFAALLALASVNSNANFLALALLVANSIQA